MSKLFRVLCSVDIGTMIIGNQWCQLHPGLGSIPELELELTSIPIPIPELELELQAMELELELELQNGIDRNWNGIEDSISIPPSILLTFSFFLFC